MATQSKMEEGEGQRACVCLSSLSPPSLYLLKSALVLLLKQPLLPYLKGQKDQNRLTVSLLWIVLICQPPKSVSTLPYIPHGGLRPSPSPHGAVTVFPGLLKAPLTQLLLSHRETQGVHARPLLPSRTAGFPELPDVCTPWGLRHFPSVWNIPFCFLFLVTSSSPFRIQLNYDAREEAS